MNRRKEMKMRKSNPGKSMQDKTNKPHSLCELCRNACGKCSWSADLIPVDGWTAEETVLSELYNPLRSYHVSACPLFQADGERHTETILTESLRPLIFKIVERAIHDYAFAIIKVSSGFKYSESAHNATTKDAELRADLIACERFFLDPRTEEMLDICGIGMTGDHIVRKVREDPQGVLDRMIMSHRDDE